MFDLRIPTGWFFTLIGLILIGVGLTSSARPPLTATNVNLYAGAAMTLFGGGMLWLTRLKS